MSVSSISFKSAVVDNKTKQDIKPKRTLNVSSFGGSLGALALGGVVHQVGPSPFAKPILENMKKIGSLNPEDGKVVHNAVKQMLQDSGLKDKGVRIKFLSSPKKPPKIDNNKFLKTVYEMLYVDSARRGENAFFCPKDLKLPKITLAEYEKLAKSGDSKLLAEKLKEQATLIKGNSVLLSKEKFQTAGFHELGHALNYNFSNFGRFLQKCRPVAMFAPIVLGIYGAVTKKSKPKYEGQELSGKQKFNNFIRDNAGKLAFAASLPMLIEEGLATQKGNAFAKKLLSPEFAKKVSKSNAVAYCSYLLAAVFGALGARVAVKIKDNAIHKKETKAKLKQELELAKAS